MQPERLTNEIAAFVDEVWAKPAARRSGRPATKRAAAKRPSTTTSRV
jgi:hypothetical protein